MLQDKTLPQNCEHCATHPRARERWGCDRPAKVPQMALKCPRCKGAKCELCNHRGMIDVWDCPVKVVQKAEIGKFFTDYWALEKGLFKEDFYQLPADFIDACRLFEHLQSELRNDG